MSFISQITIMFFGRFIFRGNDDKMKTSDTTRHCGSLPRVKSIIFILLYYYIAILFYIMWKRIQLQLYCNRSVKLELTSF